jgi:phosphatidylglycerol---prolipoprotein diacylglyceryl transferase
MTRHAPADVYDLRRPQSDTAVLPVGSQAVPALTSTSPSCYVRPVYCHDHRACTSAIYAIVDRAAVLPSLTIAGHFINTYSILVTVYFLLALLLTHHLASRTGIDARHVHTLFVGCVPTGIIGARLLDVLEYSDRYRSWADVVGRQGSSIYGALLVMGIIVVGYARVNQLRPFAILDAGAPAMALGEGFSRVGCFLSGCCYGIPSNGPWSVTFPSVGFAYRDQLARGLVAPGATHSLPVHPVQLYSAALAFGAALMLLRLVLRPHREGTAFFGFLVFYGSLRLLMAPLRQEALLSMKLFSVGFIVAGVVGLLCRRPVASSTGRQALSATR